MYTCKRRYVVAYILRHAPHSTGESNIRHPLQFDHLSPVYTRLLWSPAASGTPTVTHSPLLADPSTGTPLIRHTPHPAHPSSCPLLIPDAAHESRGVSFASTHTTSTNTSDTSDTLYLNRPVATDDPCTSITNVSIKCYITA